MRNPLFKGTFLIATLFCGIPAPADEAPVERSAEGHDRIEKLIKQLGHPRYVLREQAQAELAQMGAPILDALSVALSSDDIEIAMRARYLLTAINIDWVYESDPPHIRKAMEKYAKENESQRKNVILKLARRTDNPELSALCRIVRYDRSTRLSKFAALVILDTPLQGDRWKDRRELLNKQLKDSRRPAAQWVQHHINDHPNRQIQVDEWVKVTENENQLWRETSDKTNREIVQKVLLHLIELLKNGDREDETADYEDQIVKLQSNSDQSIRELVELLLQRDLPRVIEKLGDKFSDLFSSDPSLLYALAYAKQSLAKEAAATDLVAKARKINPSMPANHFVVGYHLQRHGWYEWAEAEYQIAIDIDGMKTPASQQAINLLSEMLHDQKQDERAAEVLEPLVALLKRDPEQRAATGQINRNPNSIYSRLHFFRACQHELEGNIEGQKKELLLAVGEDPKDADALIALFRLPDQTSEEQQATKARIVDAMNAFRARIKKQRNSATPLNQFAWLVGNTLGESDPVLAEEAIRCSHKSLEFNPDAAGYFDTLGRCYYAKGDIENALKYQAEAVRLDPHSGLIRRQFEFFKRSRKE
ncbi:MAG: hypothetical protein P8K78_03705 [Pirellulales bacterium]|nr:hypothetical protein [Pirellulales bacterium]